MRGERMSACARIIQRETKTKKPGAEKPPIILLGTSPASHALETERSDFRPSLSYYSCEKVERTH